MDLNKMIKRAQTLQNQLKSELADMTVSATSGGGMVKATVAGTKTVKSLSIAPEVIDPDDPEMLQDLVIAAVNEALRKVDLEVQSKVGSLASGLPGLDGLS